MTIRCPECGQDMEAEDDLVVGQHVICPYCQVKFSFGCETLAGEKKQAEKTKEDEEVRIIDGHSFRDKLFKLGKWPLVVGCLVVALALCLCFIGDGPVKIMKESVDPATKEVPIFGVLEGEPQEFAFGGNYDYDDRNPYRRDKAKVITSYIGDGAVVSNGKGRFFVKTDRKYAEGDRLATAVYRCIGRANIKTQAGEPMVLMAVEELRAEESKSLLSEMKEIYDNPKSEKAKRAEGVMTEYYFRKAERRRGVK